MNDRARRSLRGMRGDGRNPYGSRGGYVTSRDPRRSRRDRGEDYDYPMDSRYERPDGHHYSEYDEYPHEEMCGSFELDRRYYGRGDSYDDYADMRDYRRGRRGGRDYADEEDYRGRRRNSRGEFMRDRRDYGDDEDEKLSKHEMKEWEKDLENADGSRGAHFTAEQIDQVARSLGIEPKEFGDGVLCMTVNMLYSDYCMAAKKFNVDRIEFYIEMAKAFLKDKDFDGDGAEKLFLYYTFIADDEK